MGQWLRNRRTGSIVAISKAIIERGGCCNLFTKIRDCSNSLQLGASPINNICGVERDSPNVGRIIGDALNLPNHQPMKFDHATDERISTHHNQNTPATLVLHFAAINGHATTTDIYNLSSL